MGPPQKSIFAPGSRCSAPLRLSTTHQIRWIWLGAAKRSSLEHRDPGAKATFAEVSEAAYAGISRPWSADLPSMGNGVRPITTMLIATAISWVVWFGLVLGTDPDAIGWIGIAVFSAALFAAVSGTTTVIGLFVRRHAPDRAATIRIAVRQGVLVGIAVVIAAFLQSRQLLSWVNILFLIVALTLFEFFLISLRSTSNDELPDHHELAA